MTKKVLIIAQYFPPDMGGGATRASNVAKGLSKAGCEVTVVAGFPHYPTGNIPTKYRWKPLIIEHEDGLRIFRTFLPPLASEGFAKRALLFTCFLFSSLSVLPFVGKVDVVWVANPNVISFYTGLIFGLVKRCNLFLNVDDLWPEALYDLGLSRRSALAKIGEAMARIAYRLASAITPISPAYINFLKNRYNIDPEKIRVIPAGVDLSRFPCKEKDIKEVDGTFRILYIGAFSQAYDFDQVFKAAKLLSSTNVEFIIQGGGELSNSLKSRARKMALNNLKIIDTIVSRDEVARTLYNADALLLPLNGGGSIEMGISSKLYEYQAAAKPIICCSEGQPAKYVSQTKSGMVVSPGNPEALAESILHLHKNRDVAKKMGIAGRRFVEKNLELKDIGYQIRKVFEELN